MTETRAVDPVEDLASAAIEDDSERNADAAVEIITEAREPQDEPISPDVIEIEQPRESQPRAKQPRMTKAEAIAELERSKSALADLQSRMQTLEARTNTQAIDDLGATFALALSIGSRFVAAQRGPHWVFKDDESKNVGDAWAVVAAPYASRLKTFVPWALAIGVTWKALEPRLEQDKVLAAESAPEVATADNATS